MEIPPIIIWLLLRENKWHDNKVNNKMELFTFFFFLIVSNSVAQASS